jgi:hypothetical protein
VEFDTGKQHLAAEERGGGVGCFGAARLVRRKEIGERGARRLLHRSGGENGGGVWARPREGGIRMGGRLWGAAWREGWRKGGGGPVVRQGARPAGAGGGLPRRGRAGAGAKGGGLVRVAAAGPLPWASPSAQCRF